MLVEGHRHGAMHVGVNSREGRSLRTGPILNRSHQLRSNALSPERSSDDEGFDYESPLCELAKKLTLGIFARRKDVSPDPADDTPVHFADKGDSIGGNICR